MTTSVFISQEFFPTRLRSLVGVLLLALFVARLDAQSVFIERKPVRSSDLASVGYDARQRLLEIEFHSGGIYRYLEVPPEIHGQLLAADSKGRFFATRIRDQFRCQRVKVSPSTAR